MDYIYLTIVNYFIPGKSPNQTSETQTDERLYFLDLHHLKLSHSRREGSTGWPLWKTGATRPQDPDNLGKVVTPACISPNSRNYELTPMHFILSKLYGSKSKTKSKMT